MRKKLILIFAVTLLTATGVSAQVRIGSDDVPHKAAILDLNVDDNINNGKLGLALPRVDLGRWGTDTKLSPSGHLRGLLVYNTATTTHLAVDKNVTPGVYYNDGTRWVRIGTGTLSVSLGQGSVDGTIQLNVNGGTADIAVTGLNTAAYKETADFIASPAPEAYNKVLLAPTAKGDAPGTKEIETAPSSSSNLITSRGVYEHTVSNLTAGDHIGQIKVTIGDASKQVSVQGLAASPSNYVFATAASGTADAFPSLRKLVAADIPVVDATKIVDAPIIDAAHLANGAVTTGKLKGESVAGAKIADNTITALQLAPGVVTADKIADAAVTSAKISGPIPITQGGTGATSVIQNGVIYASSADAMASTTAGTTGQFLTATSATPPAWKTIAEAGAIALPPNPQIGQVVQYKNSAWIPVGVPVFTACTDCGTVTDTDNNVYTTRTFGTAGTWMTQNLRAANFAGGSPITGYSYPNNDPLMVSSGGLLYNWAAVQANPCPTGWSVPSDADWSALEHEIADNPDKYSTTIHSKSLTFPDDVADSYRGAHGTMMKSSLPVLHATRPSSGYATPVPYPVGCSKLAADGGFAALLVGSVNSSGTATNYGRYGYFWSNTDSGNDAWCRYVSNDKTGVYRGVSDQANRYSVRCKQ
ncbi:hypothetical protein EZS27_016856 [termite gut metagenome]|uniref:Fibrobacter succinogenes major paralogous domain-containing protein n=1 Tax=termite gut metagenome TaxID=433724 RepID=A0A5J4RL90_9ZZZZ